MSRDGLMAAALRDIEWERRRQLELWPNQSHKDGTANTSETRWQRMFDQMQCNAASVDGTVTWREILQEEVSEAFAETDWRKLRKELVQIAAVCTAWIEDGDSR